MSNSISEPEKAGVSVFICGKRPNLGRCETCGGRAVGSCEFKVKRRGESERTLCARKFCRSCQMTMPLVGVCCMPHARFLGASA